MITRFQFTQDENLYSQLAYGIRYLDMRVGAYNMTRSYSNSSSTTTSPSISAIPGTETSTIITTTASSNNNNIFIYEELWMVHDIQRNHINLNQALSQVKRFLEHTSHEVVIVDFHRFVNGFDQVDDLAAVQTRLRNFYKIVVNNLGPYLIRFRLVNI